MLQVHPLVFLPATSELRALLAVAGLDSTTSSLLAFPTPAPSASQPPSLPSSPPSMPQELPFVPISSTISSQFVHLIRTA